MPPVSVVVSQSLTPPPAPHKVGAFGGPIRWFELGSARAAITVLDCGGTGRYEDVSWALDGIRLMQDAEIGTNLVKLRWTNSEGEGEVGTMADDC